MKSKLAMAIATCFIFTLAHGGELYRWTDEKGQIHYGESPPSAQKNRSRAVDTGSAGVTEAQRQEAEARVAREKGRLNQKARNDAPGGGTAAPPHAPSAANPPASCEEQWKQFEAAAECFGPYRNATGGIKAEAYNHCTEVRQPDCKREAK